MERGARSVDRGPHPADRDLATERRTGVTRERPGRQLGEHDREDDRSDGQRAVDDAQSSQRLVTSAGASGAVRDRGHSGQSREVA